MYEELYNKGTSAEFTTHKLIHAHMTSSSEDMKRLHRRELDMINQILTRMSKDDLEKELLRFCFTVVFATKKYISQTINKIIALLLVCVF